MMKKTALVLLSVAFALPAFSQSIFLRGGTDYEIDPSQFSSVRAELGFAYAISTKFELALYTGYIAYHFDASQIYVTIPSHTFHYIPVMASIHYAFSDVGSGPYLSLDFGNIFDVTSAKDRKVLGSNQFMYDRDRQHNRVLKLGGGMRFPVTNNMAIDVSAKITHPQNSVETIELMAGMRLGL